MNIAEGREKLQASGFRLQAQGVVRRSGLGLFVVCSPGTAVPGFAVSPLRGLDGDASSECLCPESLEEYVARTGDLTSRFGDLISSCGFMIFLKPEACNLKPEV
jgi:hypothetical protein